MKPLLHPSSIFTFWFTLFIISINIQTPLCADSKYYTNCDEAFSCDGSSVGNLKYPFRGGNRPDYCGQSELEFTCSQDGAAKITINSITYRVVKWEDSTQNLRVARDDFWGGVCAVSDYQNSSLDNSPFQYDYSGDGNVTLLYNCGSIDPPNGFFSSSCDGGGDVYYVVRVGPLSFSSACTSVVVPVLASHVSALATAAGNINEALKEGFGLRWTGNYQECRVCAESGGACGFFDGEFRCFCTDGPHTSTCRSETASAPGMPHPMCIFH